jgi:ParB-like chromosome segregation protein Spo0J
MELRRVPPTSLDLTLGRLRQLPEAAVREKLSSLRSKGQLSPLVAAEQGDVLVLVDGFVRQMAAVRLGLDSVLVEVVQLSPVQMKAQVYLRNRERGLLLLEECRLVRELCDADGLNQVEIAELLERHKSWVCRRLSLFRSLSPNLVCDLSLGLLGPGSLRRLAQLPPRNQEELVAVARRDELSPRDTAAFIDLWRRASDGEARQYLLDHPKAALELARGERPEPADPRLGEAARQLQTTLVALAQLALRARRRVDDGLGAVPADGLRLLAKARRDADELCGSALDAVRHWLTQQQETSP